jgi:hypothetical protein
VTLDIDSLSFNTAIARMMEFVNFFTKEKHRPGQRWNPSYWCWLHLPPT